MIENKQQAAIDSYFDTVQASLFPVSLQYKMIHVHIPKTAGTALRRPLFDSEVVRHVRASEIPLALWEAFPSITIVRHPIERLLSSYKYHVMSGYSGVLLKRHPDLKSLSLEAYVDRFVGKSDLLGMQKSYISRDDSTKPIVDHVIRFEHINEELPKILEGLGVDVKINVVKQSPKNKVIATKAVLKQIKAHYKEDYETFGYS